MIDNYDSFTYNLVQYFGELGEEVVVRRNDEITLDQIKALAPQRICISPGPCAPDQAGISVEVLKRFGPHVPVLGVCLGHQAIGCAFGGRIVRAQRLMHGKTDQVQHDSAGVFKGLPQHFTVTRYHSLVIEEESLPAALVVTSRASDGEIMGVRHKTLPIEGVQFHPESVLTDNGRKLIENFLKM
jgi:anthranilate synthase component 2